MNNKIFSNLASTAVLSFSSMQAKTLANTPQNIVATQKVASLSQSDMQVLFDGVEANRVAVLDTEEMKATKGEVWWAIPLTGLGVGLVSWGLSCLFNNACKDFNASFTFPI